MDRLTQLAPTRLVTTPWLVLSQDHSYVGVHEIRNKVPITLALRQRDGCRSDGVTDGAKAVKSTSTTEARKSEQQALYTHCCQV